MAAAIRETGYREATVADVVRHARTSRRTFYEHFPGKQACFNDLLREANAVMIRQIGAAVDRRAPWDAQVRQAIEAWIEVARADLALTLSWIRDLPSLGADARHLQREWLEAFIVLVRELTDTRELRAAGVAPPSRQLMIMMLGGLRELIAATVEDGGDIGGITAVTGAVAHFIAHVARPDEPARAITAEFRAIGGAAAREGSTLDALQDALRLGARVAWRWLSEADAGLDRRELSHVGEAIFAYLDELAAACAQGYAEARVQAAGDRQRRLLAAIVSDPPPRAELLASLARSVGWVLPAQVAVVVLGGRQDGLLLPPGVLADWTGPEPCLLVPDPDGPGRQAAIDRALGDRALSDRSLGGRPAAIGPSVPLARAAMSLRWARHALGLARAGVIPRIGDGGGRPRVTGTVAGWTQTCPRHRNGNFREPRRCADRLVSVW